MTILLDKINALNTLGSNIILSTKVNDNQFLFQYRRPDRTSVIDFIFTLLIIAYYFTDIQYKAL